MPELSPAQKQYLLKIKREKYLVHITGKMIAKEIGCSLSGANYKLKVLKKEGRIRFNGAGGKGCWEILE